MTIAVSLEDVSYSYGDRPAVSDVSLQVPVGDFLGIVGPNGSGKTTLLKLMLGLEQPDRGTAYLFGRPTLSFEARERLGYVPQVADTGGRYMPVTVEEVVRMGRFGHLGFRRFGQTDHRRVDGAIEAVGIGNLRERRFDRLSGGQRQRALIARAIASEADLLALDEPAVGIDAASRESFYRLLEGLHDNGVTIVLIEHDLEIVIEYAAHVAYIDRTLRDHRDAATFPTEEGRTGYLHGRLPGGDQ